MDKIYINGKCYIPEEDILLCDTDPARRGMSIEWGESKKYQKLYATEKDSFYMIEKSGEDISARILSREEAEQFAWKNPISIITDNYDKVFGIPERG